MACHDAHLSHGFGGGRAFFWRSFLEGLDKCNTVTAFCDCMYMHSCHLGEHAHLPLSAHLRVSLQGPGGLVCALQAEVKTERLVKFVDERRCQLADSFTNPPGCYGPDLLSLCFGILAQPGLARWQQDLEGVDPRGVRGHGHHDDDAASQPGRCGVGGIVGGNPGVSVRGPRNFR